MQSAEQDKKTEQSSQASQSKDQSKDQGQAAKADQSGDKSAAKSAGQQDKSSPVPTGAQKVTERIKTETTREYLDAQGKVIGTEKTVNEQEKIVPPDMLKQQAEPAKDATKDQGEQSSKDKEKAK